MSEVKIVSKGPTTHTFIDGIEIHNIVDIQIEYGINKCPIVGLKLLSRDLEILCDDVEVKIERDQPCQK